MTINIIFSCYPIVYRVDLDQLDSSRLEDTADRLTKGSEEYLIKVLREAEFDILFLDFDDDPDLKALYEGELNQAEAFLILESRFVTP